MKILFFIPRMCGGGAERVVANLANAFDRHGEDVVIYTPTDNKSFYPLQKSVRIVGENYSVSKRKYIRQIKLAFHGIRLWFSYKRRINDEKPDVIISFLTATNIIALTHKNNGCRLIVSERTDPTKRNLLTQRIIRYLYMKADVLVCQSKEVEKYFHSAHSVVIPNPIDNSVLPEMFYGVRRKTVVGVGRLMKQKNFSNLIKAFSMLPEELSEYTLEIYGEGVLRAELQALIQSARLTKRIKLMGAYTDVLERIKDASLFVMSSDFEGYPNALAEAMAIGLPVICTDFDSGTARELIHENNGILVPVGDSKALSKAIETLLLNEDTQMRMSEENRKVKEKLSIQHITDMWYEIMRSELDESAM